MKLLLDQGLPPYSKGTLGGIPEGRGEMSKNQQGDIILVEQIEPRILVLRGRTGDAGR